jgi:hypothetical protein
MAGFITTPNNQPFKYYAIPSLGSAQYYSQSRAQVALRGDNGAV